jgi:hypothetical protein
VVISERRAAHQPTSRAWDSGDVESQRLLPPLGRVGGILRGVVGESVERSEGAGLDIFGHLLRRHAHGLWYVPVCCKDGVVYWGRDGDKRWR